MFTGARCQSVVKGSSVPARLEHGEHPWPLLSAVLFLFSTK